MRPVKDDSYNIVEDAAEKEKLETVLREWEESGAKCWCWTAIRPRMRY